MTLVPGTLAFSASRRIQRHQLSVIDDSDAIAQAVGFVHVVGRNQDGQARAYS